MSNESKTRVERLRENFQADMTGSVPLAFAEKILAEAEAEAAAFKDQRDAFLAMAKAARYEADGTALLSTEGAMPLASHDSPEDGVCRCYDCGIERIDNAYREQHARDVALLRRVEREAEAKTSQDVTSPQDAARWAAVWSELDGVRACIEALSEGTSK